MNKPLYFLNVLHLLWILWHKLEGANFCGDIYLIYLIYLIQYPEIVHCLFIMYFITPKLLATSRDPIKSKTNVKGFIVILRTCCYA